MEQQINNQQQSSAQPQTQNTAMVTGKSRDPFKMWMVIFALLFVATAGFAVWQTLQLNGQSSKVAELESDGNDLKATNDSLQQQIDELNGVGSSDSTSGDTDKILAAVDAYTRADTDAEGFTFEYTITRNADGFAKVRINSSDDDVSFAWVKKVGNNWTVVESGDDSLTQEVIDEFKIPSSVQ